MTTRERNIYDEIVRLDRLLTEYKTSGQDIEFIIKEIATNIGRLDNLQNQMTAMKQIRQGKMRR